MYSQLKVPNGAPPFEDWIPVAEENVKPKNYRRVRGWKRSITNIGVEKSLRYFSLKVLASSGRRCAFLIRGKLDYDKIICGCNPDKSVKVLLVSGIFINLLKVYIFSHFQIEGTKKFVFSYFLKFIQKYVDKLCKK